MAELVRTLGLPRAIVTRLLTTLEEARYVERTGSRTYRLGPELIALGKAVRSDLREIAATVLRGLADKVGATVVLVMRDADHAMVISVVEPMHTDLRLSFRLGSRHLLHQGAEGMAILAGNPPVPGERKEVTDARRSGYAVSVGEILAGTWGLAVPMGLVPGAGHHERRCDMRPGPRRSQHRGLGRRGSEGTSGAGQPKRRAELTGELS